MSTLFRLAFRYPIRFRTSRLSVPGIKYSRLLSCQSVVGHIQCRCLATADASAPKEQVKGPTVKKQFQAETQKLLDIVAKSLYSEKEVFVRELISNASDAIERLRFHQMSTESGATETTVPLEIRVTTDEKKRLLIIEDTGIGMTKDEMEQNLGTIARSGSREFLSNLGTGSHAAGSADIIGQFGVGFYATFMVADKVEVYSRGQLAGDEAIGHRWSSTGHDGEFEVCEAENVKPGTKIILQLKESASEFAQESKIEAILRKYSNFVGVPIYLNDRRINIVEPIWLLDPSKITEENHLSFYQYLCGNAYDSPRYTLMYKTDAPINLRTLLYVPSMKPSLFDMARDGDDGVSLYSRKILIMNRTGALLPKWLRFLRGVVDSEDIPLNLSRELLQDSALINRIKRLLTSRVLRFLSQQASRDREKFEQFLKDFGLYLKEGLITESEQETREEIAKLLRWESSALPSGQTTSLEEYATRMTAGERTIYFLSAPSRQLAETSPYLEALRKKSPKTEVLYLYEPYDELVLMQLNQFDRKHLQSVETVLAEDAADTDSVGPERPNCLTQEQASTLVEWAKTTLGRKVKNVKVTQRLENHPCFVSIRDAGAMRHFLRTSLSDRPAEERYYVMEPVLELNPQHDLIRYLSDLVANKSSGDSEDLAKILLDYLYDTAMAQAGLLDDVRGMANRTNDLVGKLVNRVTSSSSL